MDCARDTSAAIPWPTGDRRFMVVAAHNICAMHRLERLALGFNAAGVPLLLLKGAALHLALGLEPEARPMSDVDILVPLEQVARAVEVLVKQGARRGADLVRPDFFPRFYYEQEYHFGDVRPTRIDLHARPFRPLRYARLVPPNAFWDRAQAVRLGEATVLLPQPADMLLHLATHAAVHAFANPRWLDDVRRWLAAYGGEIDWTYLTRTARAWGLALPLRQTLARVADASVPTEALELVDRMPVRWSDRLALWQAPRDATHPVQHVVVDVMCAGAWRSTGAYLCAVLLPSRTHMAAWYTARHPGWLWCAYIWRAVHAPVAGVIKTVARFWTRLRLAGAARGNPPAAAVN